MILGYFNTVFLLYMVAVTAVLSNLTALQRIAFVVKFAGGSPKQQIISKKKPAKRKT